LFPEILLAVVCDAWLTSIPRCWMEVSWLGLTQ